MSYRRCDHLAFINERYATLAEGGTPPEDEPDYEDPVSAFVEQAARARVAFARPGYLSEVAPTPIGPQPGSVTVQHVVNELSAHGWDLARSIGAGTDLYPDVAEHAKASWQVFVEVAGRDGTFADEQPAPAGASAADQLAGYLGRAG